MDYLPRTKLPVATSLTRYICWGVLSSYERHSIKEFVRDSYTVSLNTDDPLSFGTGLSEGDLILTERRGLDLADIRKMIASAIQSSDLPEDDRNKLFDTFSAEYAESGTEA